MKKWVMLFGVLAVVGATDFALAQTSRMPAEVEKEYKALVAEADHLSATGEYEKALDVLQKLIDHPKLPAFDRAVMGLNKAVVFGKMNKPEDALQAMDQALAIPFSGAEVYILENKAILLTNLGRMQESLDVYKALLKMDKLDPASREKFQKNVNVLEEFFRKTANLPVKK